MIDYLEDLLEEEAAVELTGRPLVPVGRRKIPLWEEEEASLPMGRELTGDSPANGADLPEKGGLTGSGRPSWAEEAAGSLSGAVHLLTGLRRAAWTAGAVRQQGKPLTVTLAGENARSGELDLHTIDRAVRRDARRYDGGFPLY